MKKPWVNTIDYQGECRRTKNGSDRIIWATMVSACGVVFIGFMAWMNSMNGHITNVEATMNMRWERLAAVESLVKSIDTRLLRIEDKVDAILGRKK